VNDSAKSTQVLTVCGGPSFPCRWKCLGESLLAMYSHLTTCEPPRPSLGKRIDLSDYQDPSQLLASSVVVTPVSVVQPSPICTNPTVAVAEPVLSYTSVTAASFPLHSPSLLDTGTPMGEQTLWPHIHESPCGKPSRSKSRRP
jgi:calcineurin-binding protein cabin-1